MTSITDFQKAGLIAAIVSLPFVWYTLSLLLKANKSKGWPVTKGTIVKGLSFNMSGTLDFLYEYIVNGQLYQGKKPFFTNSFKKLGREKTTKLLNSYPQGLEVNVYYNPMNPKISTLEPGRNDGVFTSFLIVFILFLLGFTAFFFPELLYLLMY